MPQYGEYNQIAGISQVRRLPRAGKIRLGVKKRSQRGAEYPAEVPYFVANPEDFASAEAFRRFQEVYGEKPTEIDVMFPVENRAVFFPQAFKKYASTGLVCKGDGVTFTRTDRETGEVLEGDCPTPEACEFAVDDKGRTVCKRMANLIVLLPRVTYGGTFQIDTSSFNSIVDINSAIDFYRTLAGRIAMVPLKLRRVPKETQYGGNKATHYPMQLAFPDSKEEIVGLLEQAKKVREVFDVFNPGLQLESPETERDLIARPHRPAPLPEPKPEAEPEPPAEEDPPDDFPEDPMPEDAGRLLSPEERTPQTEGAAVAERARKAREEATDGNGGTKKRSLF